MSGENNIYLVGISGSGKSTVGEALASQLDWQFIDLDERIEYITHQSIKKIFTEEGEEAFRMYEKAALKSTEKIKRTVVACGGGVVILPEVRKWLKKQTTVWLQVDPTEALSRLGGEIESRPLLTGEGGPETRLKNLLAERKPFYLEATRIQIKTDGMDPTDVAFNIQMELGFVSDVELNGFDDLFKTDDDDDEF